MASAWSGTSASRSVARRSTPCHDGQEAGERRRLDRLDLAAKRGERGAPQPAQHVGVAPLALGPAGPELAADECSSRSSSTSTAATSRPKRSSPRAVVNGPRPLA